MNYDPITTLKNIVQHLGISIPQVNNRLQRARLLIYSPIRQKDETATQRLMELRVFLPAGR